MLSAMIRTALRTGLAVSLLTATLVAAGSVPTGRTAAAATVTARGSLPATAARSSRVVVVIRALTARSTTATLTVYVRRSTRTTFTRGFGPVPARIGARGLGPTREGLSRTPAGLFTLSQAFGNQANNGTSLPYFRAGRTDWWDEFPASATYNRHVKRSRSPGGASENLLAAGPAYAHAVVIDYNRWPVVRGGGSGFFLHVSTGGPTAGCVAVSASSLTTVMRRLAPALRPLISIGVGAAAPAPVSAANAAVVRARRHNPVGYLDSATRGHDAAGRPNVHLLGWAFDPDGPSTRLTLSVRVAGASTTYRHTGVRRDDVARRRGAGPRQGFSFHRRLRPGRHTVCVYAANVGAGTGARRIGCATVTVR